MRFMPSYGGSLQVPGSPDRRCLIGKHIRHPAHSGGSCPPVGVLITLGPHSSHQEHVCCIRNAFVASGTHLLSHSFRRFVPSCGGSCRIGNTFVVSFVIPVVPEVRASNGGSLRVLGSPSCHHRGMCSSRRSSSHLFHRFLPSCGGSL